MKLIRAIIAPLLLLGLSTGILSCRESGTKDVKVVAMATLMSHPALDQVSEGIREELQARGWKEGENLRYIVRNANQQMAVVPTIANDLVSQEPDVIVAITTPMAQAVKKVARGPVVFAAVTDPVGAGVVADVHKGEENITGTSDAWPYRDQLELIRKILPGAKTLGVLYNPGEAASQYGVRKIREYAPEFGFKLVEGGVNSVGEVRPVAENIIDQVDALFLSSDNTVIGGSVGALKAAIAARKPLFVGDSGTVEKGGLATVSVGYKELGRRTGELVDRTLRGERRIPTVVASGSDLYLNQKAAELMGVTFPQDVIKRATKIYDTIAQ